MAVPAAIKMNYVTLLAEEHLEEIGMQWDSAHAQKFDHARIRICLRYLHNSKNLFGFYFEELADCIVTGLGRAWSLFAFRTMTPSPAIWIKMEERDEKRQGGFPGESKMGWRDIKRKESLVFSFVWRIMQGTQWVRVFGFERSDRAMT